MYQSPDFT